MDAASFKRKRGIELKHGRAAMLATIGYIVPHFYKFDGYLSPSLGLKFTDVPEGLAALSKVPTSGIAQIIAFGGYLELFYWYEEPNRPAGDFRNAGSLGVPGGPPAYKDKERKLAAELANGRLAMMAIIGMFFQDGLTGSAWGDWSLYTDSPLRAMPKAIAGTGGPLPNMEWDPLGLAKNKSEEEVLFYRAAELKHGRVAMCAVIGWFHVAAGFHPLGNLVIDDIASDNPLVNLTQLPMGGMWQIIFSILVMEWVFTVPCPPPAERPWDLIGWTDVIVDEESPKWKEAQVRELNNGRLAMIAIMGLIVQDLVTGDYAGGVGQRLWGANEQVGMTANSWSSFWPSTGFHAPQLYPGQPVNPLFY